MIERPTSQWTSGPLSFGPLKLGSTNTQVSGKRTASGKASIAMFCDFPVKGVLIWYWLARLQAQLSLHEALNLACMSISRYSCRLLPIMLMNGHCVLPLKKCAQMRSTESARWDGRAAAWWCAKGCWGADVPMVVTARSAGATPSSSSSSKSTTAQASSTMYRTQWRMRSSLSTQCLCQLDLLILSFAKR